MIKSTEAVNERTFVVLAQTRENLSRSFVQTYDDAVLAKNQQLITLAKPPGRGFY
jgi:hypothetical protein